MAIDNLEKTTTMAHILPLHEVNKQQQTTNPKPNLHSHSKSISNSVLTVWHQSAKHAGLPMVSISSSHIIHLAWQAGGY